MELVVGEVDVSDVDDFLERLGAVGERHGSAVQAIDARFVAGERHLETAASLARRSRNRGEAIADDPSLEILLYAAGTRQIDRALSLGVSPGTTVAGIVIDGGDSTAASDDVRSTIVEQETGIRPDRIRLCEWFEITDAEIDATDATLEDLVCERVALLTVDR